MISCVIRSSWPALCLIQTQSAPHKYVRQTPDRSGMGKMCTRRMNRSYLVPLFWNESSRKTFRTKMSDFLENERVGGTHFHMNGIAQTLVLAQRQKATRRWPFGRGIRSVAITPLTSSHRIRDNLSSYCVDHKVYQSVDVILQYFEVEVHDIHWTFDVLSLLFSFYPTNLE